MTVLGITFSAAVLWLFVAGIMSILEAITLGLTCIWFAGGAVGASIAAMLGAPGKEGIVEKEIPVYGSGQVRVGGKMWTAVSPGNKIAEGSIVIVKDVRGVTLTVEEKKSEE